jgi:nicotinate-nucleotide adenylyltransferase
VTQPLGLMGGTFDPLHFGHLRLAEEALESLSLGEVRWIPSGNPGHRDAPAASARHRLEMVRLGTAAQPRFTLDDYEIASASITYSIDMLSRVRAEVGPAQPLVMILGTDSFLTLSSWRDWQALFALTHFAVGERPGYALSEQTMPRGLAQAYLARASEPAALSTLPSGAIVSFRSTLLDISASTLRAKLAAGTSVRYLLPAAVLDYIGANGLYRRSSDL